MPGNRYGLAHPFVGQYVPDGGVGRSWRCLPRYFHLSVYGIVIVTQILVGVLPFEGRDGAECTEFPALFLQFLASFAFHPGHGLFQQ